MWDCLKCGCMAIAHDLLRCPMCWKEKEVPKISLGGATNRFAVPGEPGYMPPPETEPVKAAPEPPAPRKPAQEPQQDQGAQDPGKDALSELEAAAAALKRPARAKAE